MNIWTKYWTCGVKIVMRIHTTLETASTTPDTREVDFEEDVEEDVLYIINEPTTQGLIASINNIKGTHDLFVAICAYDGGMLEHNAR